MIKTNLEKLVDLAVAGSAGHPSSCGSDGKTSFDGGSYVPVGFSGINFTRGPVDGKVVATIQREALPGEFRANIHLGGSASIIKPTIEEKRIAIY